MPEAFLTAYSPQIQTIAQRLRQLITTIVAEVDEAVSVGWQRIGSHVRDGKKRHYVAVVALLSAEVAMCAATRRR